VRYEELRDRSEIQPVQELERHLMSLVKHKIIKKLTNPRTYQCNANDEFEVNSDFESRLLKFSVPLLNLKERAKKEDEEISSKLDEDRRHTIEAVIVRVMKSRKRLDHNQLITEVLKQASEIFSPTTVMIKERIETLIEKEYLARDPADRRMYDYLA